jgi:hypothetical protein
LTKNTLYIAMKLHSGGAETIIPEYAISRKYKLELPDGCAGILTVFRTKKQARAYWGKSVKLVEIKKMMAKERLSKK